jgi:pimeloyl-ACP methyl ester carboxylesterase
MNHRQFARDVIAFCRALGVARAAFCGQSSGGMLLLTLALEAPDLAAALVLSGVTHRLNPSDEVRARNARLTPDDFLRESDDPGKLVARHSPQGPDAWRAVVAAFYAVSSHAPGEDFPEPEALRGIAAPTLIVHGDRDPFFPVAIPAELYGLLPDAELCILPRTGHGPPMERPAWFNPIALDFLARRLDTANLG